MGQIDGTEITRDAGGGIKERGERESRVLWYVEVSSASAFPLAASHTRRLSGRQVRGLMPCCNSGKSMLLKHLAMLGDEVQSE